MSHPDMDTAERQPDAEQAGQADMLQALRSASLPDDFWMYSYKILPCPHGYRHSWTHCPFSHVGETARRRCPRTYNYLPDPCVNARAKRQCPNGDACPYAHNTFEQWLHPARYRTRLCYLGANCRRPTCFFAHSVEELRSVEEGENNNTQPITTSMPPLPVPPPLPLPPPLPSPSPSVSMPSSGPSSEFGALANQAPPSALPSPPAGSVAAGPGPAAMQAPHLPGMPAGAPLGLLHPVVLMGIPQPMSQQPHQTLRPELMHAHGAVYMPYQARPAMLRPVMPMAAAGAPPQALQGDHAAGPMHLQMHPSGHPQMAAVPVAVRQQARPHLVGPSGTVTVAAVHHPGSISLGPPGAVFVQGSMPPPMHGPPPPPPPPPTQGFVSPFITPGGYHRPSDGVAAPAPPPVTGRMRSYSNPGETAYFVSAGPGVGGGGAGGGSRTFGGGEQLPAWASVDTSRRPLVANLMATGAPPSRVSLTVQGSGRSSGSGGSTAVASAPRHMPAPTNRGAAVRRMSTPADASHANAPAAAAAAAAAVTAMHYPDLSGSAGSSPSLRAIDSRESPLQHQHQQQRLQPAPSADGGVDSALRTLALTKPVAAPPPTPVVAHIGGNSPYSPSPSATSSPVSLGAAAASSPSVGMAAMSCDAAVAAAAAAAAAVQNDLAILRARSSLDGAAAGSAFSRPSSSGSATSAGTMLSAYDSSAAAAAAALAAVTAGAVDGPSDAVAAVAVPYRTLLQHMLRSASASAAEPPSGLLPTMLSGGDVDAVHADLYYDDDGDLVERSSDPGPGSLHAAIRRISSEFGSAAASRNSDPGQSMPAASSPGVQQLLLPLLQSVLTEGLATGHFELVNGQLQLKGGAATAATVAAAAAGSISPTQFVVSGADAAAAVVARPSVNV